MDLEGRMVASFSGREYCIHPAIGPVVPSDENLANAEADFIQSTTSRSRRGGGLWLGVVGIIFLAAMFDVARMNRGS
jgi:hypothetical protein